MDDCVAFFFVCPLKCVRVPCLTSHNPFWQSAFLFETIPVSAPTLHSRRHYYQFMSLISAWENMVDCTSYFLSVLINSYLKFMLGIYVRLIFFKQVGSSPPYIHSAKNCLCFALKDKICSFTDSYPLPSPPPPPHQ